MTVSMDDDTSETLSGGRRRRLLAVVAIAVIIISIGIAGTRRDGPGDLGRLPPTMPADPGPAEAPGDPDPATPADPGPSVTPVSTRPPLDDPPDPGPAPDHHGFSSAELATAVASSVRVLGPGCRKIVHDGSGFAVLGGDLIVTNAHLMVGLHEPEVELANGRVLTAVPVAFDPVNDLAVLRADGADLAPLPLSEVVPDGTVGAVLAWEDEGEPDPTPFRIDRPVTVRTDIVNGEDQIERPAWLLAAEIELGDSGSALVTRLQGRTVVVGVAWGASRRGDVDVGYATRSSALEELLASTDLTEPVELPDCR